MEKDEEECKKEMKGQRTKKKSAKNRRQSGDMKLCKYQIKRIENKF